MMRKVVLYIAMSLDGYIADPDGKVDWLAGDGSDPGNAGSYAAFYETVDTIVMGYQTFHQIATELSPDKWYYSGKTSYVITHRPIDSTDEIVFTQENPAKLVSGLRQQAGRDIWICGGASIVNQLIAADLIDRYHITVIPSLQGDGIRLFEKQDTVRRLRLLAAEPSNGMVDLVYAVRETP